MAGILENLDYTIGILEEEKRLFLESRDLLEKESIKSGALRPAYMEFNELYRGFSDNVNDIIAANSDLKDLRRMHNRGEITQEGFLMRSNQLKVRIQGSYTDINEDIFPKLKELASQISIPSAPADKKREFEKERDAENKKTEEEVKGKDVIEQIKPYLKQLIPFLIKKAATIATGIPL